MLSSFLHIILDRLYWLIHIYLKNVNCSLGIFKKGVDIDASKYFGQKNIK